MDQWSKLFWQVGAFLSVMLVLAAVLALSTAENGRLTVEGLEGMAGTFALMYEVLRWVVYPWLALGVFLLVRFLSRRFGKG
ncbi:MAG: hypothetical protein IE937_08610 [Gammaproteobacteria bacterium]|nr:hypothetical protein [Gammaproteobacteria bacterium]MBD3777249.1 hypothetical protein [Thiotrichales bacterium]